MLVNLSTLLARAKRKGHPIVSAKVCHFDIAAAVARAADLRESPIVFTVDARRGVYHSPSQLLVSVLDIARGLKADCAVEVLTDANRQHIDLLFAAGAPSVTPTWEGLAVDEHIQLHEWVTLRAKAYGAETVLHLPPHATLHDCESLIEKTGAAIIRSTHAQDLQSSKIVSIDDRDDLSLAAVKKLKANAHTLSNILEQSFTAGLRTALRNRESGRSTDYLPKALLATEQSIIPYLS
jgi:hypothetical protein